MATTVAANTAAPSTLSRPALGVPVLHVRRQRPARVNTCLRASLNEAKVASVVTVVTSVLAGPVAAQAAVEATPSVNALLGSVVNGGIVGLLILAAVSLVSGFDPVNRAK